MVRIITFILCAAGVTIASSYLLMYLDFLPSPSRETVTAFFVILMGIIVLALFSGPNLPRITLCHPEGPWAGPMAMPVGIIYLRRPPFVSTVLLPHCPSQRWAEAASKKKINRLLRTIRKEVLLHFKSGSLWSRPDLFYGRPKSEYYLYQICQEDSMLLLAILEGRIQICQEE